MKEAMRKRKTLGSSFWVGLPSQAALAQPVPASWLDEKTEGPGPVDDTGFAVVRFARWAGCRWARMQALFSTEGHLGNVAHRCSVSEACFVDYLQRHGFQGDGARIFRIIQDRCRDESFRNGQHCGRDSVIRLPQFLNFKRYASALAAPMLDDELQIFVNVLRQHRGTVLRAWRLDLDRHAIGRVTFADLAAACRKLDMSGEARAIWKAVRGSEGRDREGSVVPLKFTELASEEAADLEGLVQILWLKLGFDLDKAWSSFDTGGRGVVTLDEFSRGLRSMGFDGNAKLIFRGLDVSGLGRMRRVDFAYLEVLLHGSAEAPTLGDVDPDVRAFIAWVHQVVGNPNELLTKLALLPESGQDQVPMLSVKDLATRLQVLGFPCNALRVAVAAARGIDGAQISGNSILSLFSRRRDSTLSNTASTASDGSPRTSPTSATFHFGSPRSASWNGLIHDPSAANAERSASTRNYFSVPERGKMPLWGPASFSIPASAPASPSRQGRTHDFDRHNPNEARWNNSLQDFTSQDAGRSRYARQYFGSCGSILRAETQPPARRSPAASSKRMTILPDRLIDVEATADLLSRSPNRSRMRGRSNSACDSPELRARSASACRSVGPFASASRRVTQRLGARRRLPGDDSSVASSEPTTAGLRL